MLCHSHKLMSVKVARRLIEMLDGHIPDTHAGFIQMIGRLRGGGRQAVITFIDYSPFSTPKASSSWTRPWRRQESIQRFE